MACGDDSVDIYGIKKINLCGTNIRAIYLSKPNPRLVVEFVTDSHQEGSGFKFTWQQQGRWLLYL